MPHPSKKKLTQPKKSNRLFFSGKVILIFLSTLVFIHLIAMYFYIKASMYAWGAANRSEIIQKIINAIHLVNATPKANRIAAVKAIQDRVLFIQLTDKPTETLRFKQISFWEINHELRVHQLPSFAVSVQMPDKQWLNFKAKLSKHLLFSELLLVSLEIIMAISILISARSIYTFTKPLQHFKETADRLGVDFQTQPLVEYGPVIVRETAEAMNKMQERIYDLLNNRIKMLAAISHDLRTPITRMKLRNQFEENTHLQEKNIHDLEEMEAMIHQILAFARHDPMKEKKVKLDLFSTLETICEEMADLGHQVHLNMSIKRIPFYGRPLALKRAFTNLINNAVQYATQVKVNLHENKQYIYITIQDNGPGIPEKDLNEVLKPFHRGEHSRSKTTGGVGLGLAIVHDIIKAHSGKITLQNRSANSGLLVHIELPKLALNLLPSSPD